MKMKKTASQRIWLAGFLMLATTAAVIACSWSLVTDRSVRFNSFRSGRGFYRLPPLPIMYDPATGKELSVQEVDVESDENIDLAWDDAEPKPDPVEEVWNDLQSTIDRADLTTTRELLGKFLDKSKFRNNREGDEEINQKRRSSAYDMLDAMTALSQGSKAAHVQAYVAARKAYYDSSESHPSDEARADRNLQDNWAYLAAAELYRTGDKKAAKDAFAGHLAKFRKSEKRESAAYMVAKLTMESSYSFGQTGCGIEPNSSDPVEKCQDAAWAQAVEQFQRFMLEFPKSRYSADARGWLAYLYRRGGERAKALAEYYRLLGSPNDLSARLEAKKSLQMIGHDYDDETLDKVEDLIRDDIDASMAYAYHRIYNHATDFTYVDRTNIWFYRTGANDDEAKLVQEMHRKGDHELERVARFATSMMRKYPTARVGAGFVLRVAEAQLESKNFSDARPLARKALELGLDGDLKAQALWVVGSCEHAQKNLHAARSTFEKLITEFPQSKHTDGARRLLAMVAEDRGDLETALEFYLALNYKYDVAYYVDVLMPTDRLAKFIKAHPNLPNGNKLLYALGLRFMRDNRWNEARETLAKVTAEQALDPYAYVDYEAEKRFAKENGWGFGQSNDVKMEWVMQDLKTIDTLENMEHAVDLAPDDEAKAEALYQLASFQFGSDDLLFYNPAAWEGMRSDLLEQLQTGGNMRLPDEATAILRHSQSHEGLARAIPIYIEIASRHPNTRAAKDALYSAAVAHERLSDLNNYWRTIYGRRLFAGPRMVTYADVRSAYPRYQLPRGTDGWEPATRTVNGGPGWEPKPTRIPRETKEHRVRRLLNELSGKLSETVLPSVNLNINAFIAGYVGAIKSAIYGLVVGIGLWSLVLVGISVDWRRQVRRLISFANGGPPVTFDMPDETPQSESRVEKFIEQ
jgi:TolA-binding protein